MDGKTVGKADEYSTEATMISEPMMHRNTDRSMEARLMTSGQIRDTKEL